MEPAENHEEDFILRPIIAKLNRMLRPVCTMDYGEIDSPDRPFETFEVYFALPPSTDLTPSTVDGFLFLDEIVDTAVEAIQKRYERLSAHFQEPIKGIGISTKTKWRFAHQVGDAEAMLGDLERDDYPGKFIFHARYIAPADLVAARCITELYKVPEVLPPWPWTEIERSLGVDHEEIARAKAGAEENFSWETEYPPDRQLPPSKEEPKRPWFEPPHKDPEED